MAEMTEPDHLKRGAAILATCIVQTMSETDPTFQEKFLNRLALAYAELKNNTEGDVKDEMELLTWTRTLVTGWNNITGQGEPFLGGQDGGG